MNRTRALAVLFRRLLLVAAAPSAVCLLLTAASAALPQGGSASPPAAAPATDSAATQPTFKVQGPLVVLDVVVTDSGGHPVHDLKADDFTVLERGKKMTPQSFEEHRSEQAPAATPVQPAQKPVANFFTNYTETQDNGALNILLLDALNTPFADQAYLRQQMLAYISKLPAGTRIAVFGLSSRLFILQGFTSDHEILKAALSSKKNLPKDSALLTTPQEADEQMNDNNAMAEMMGNNPNAASIMANVLQFQADMGTFQTTLRVQYTLAALDELARYLGGLPDRKNLIWLSGSFPLNIEPDGDLPDPFRATAEYADQVKDTASLLVRAQVAIYPVDARGLFVNPAMTAQVSGASFGSPQAINKSIAQFTAQTASEHGTMDAMAAETGGKAFYNTNDLTEAVRRAIDEGSNYYTITYQPADTNWNGAYRNVRVDIDRSGDHLFYVHGYYADAPGAKVQGSKVLPLRPVQVAMMRGGPDPTQIILAARIVPSDATEDKLPDCNQPKDKEEMKPPYRHYTIVAAARVGDMAFPMTPDGTYHGAFDLISVVYDADGKTMNLCANTMHADLPAAHYMAMLKSGVRMRQEIDAPAKGAYFLRIGVHDLTSDRVGAIEIPLSAIKSESAAVPAAK